MMSQLLFARSGLPKGALKLGVWSTFWEQFLDKKNAHISTSTTRSAVPFAESWLPPHFTQIMSLSTISRNLVFQKIFMGSPFAKMPKMIDFSCLENQLLRSVSSVASSTLALFLNCLMKAFIAGGSQLRSSCRWPAVAFQKVPWS